MIRPGDVISYLEMCQSEGVNLQRGMNYRLRGNISVILMSRRPGAPYDDIVEQDGQILIYEGHDAPRSNAMTNPKLVDQPMHSPGGKLTQNGLFFTAAKRAINQAEHRELVKVYEKLFPSIWVFNGIFALVDAWIERKSGRNVFKFKLELINKEISNDAKKKDELENPRIIPSSVKQIVWRRDKGQCVKCGSKDNLHFDHIIPYAKGGSSLVAENIQLLCARHNIAKKDKIE